MTDKEMIEEMAKEIFNTCAWRFGKPNDYKEICKDVAEDLIKLGYTKNKIPEGSVVLSREEKQEYESLAKLLIYDKPIKSRVYEFIKEIKEKTRKETAKEILQELYCFPHEYHEKKILELARQFGVEVEE